MSNETFNISFIGAGNVAYHLAPALENAGHTVKEVYSKSGKSAKKLLPNLYDASLAKSLDFSKSEANIFIIAVPDDAVVQVLENMVLPERSMVVHTSGALPLSVIPKNIAGVTGVLYPLQTFSKNRKIAMESVPFLLESSHKEGHAILEKLLKDVSKHVFKVNSKQRSQLHVAAVFACNFTNYMLTSSQDILKKTKIDFNLLQPLVTETIQKSFELAPKNAQTGPARRGDLQTLDKHMEILAKQPAYAEIYELLSQQILDKYQ